MLVPTLDLNNFEAKGVAYAHVVRKALENYGAFIVINHNMDTKTIKRAHEVAQHFFLGPEEQRLDVSIGKSHGIRGYFLGGTIVSNTNVKGTKVTDSVVERRYQAFEIGFESVKPVHDPLQRIFLMPNVWPQSSDFREAMLDYYEAAMVLGHKLSQIVASTLGLHERFFVERTMSPLSQMRALYYPSRSSAASQTEALGVHTDYECLSIISASTGGLEVLGRTGDWLELEPPDDGLIVLAGDVIEILSNGVFRAARHRVLQGEKERTSLIFFYGLDYDTVLAPIDSFQRDIGIQRFPSLCFGEHMVGRAIANYPHLRHMVEAKELEIPFEYTQRNPLKAIRESFGL